MRTSLQLWRNYTDSAEFPDSDADTGSILRKM